MNHRALGSVLLLLLSGSAGCSSIHSDAVRSLIDIETEKIGQARRNSAEFVKATDQAIASWEKSVQALSDSLQNQKRAATLHALTFSANQTLATKTGIHAHAASYLLSEVYLADRMGLEQAVLDQFTEDYQALRVLARQIQDSWVAMEKTQKEVAAFADRTFLASVDANLVRALIVEFGGDTEAIDQVLKRSTQVNEALKKASGLGILGSDGLPTQLVIQDVVNLLERIKK